MLVKFLLLLALIALPKRNIPTADARNTLRKLEGEVSYNCSIDEGGFDFVFYFWSDFEEEGILESEAC